MRNGCRGAKAGRIDRCKEYSSVCNDWSTFYRWKIEISRGILPMIIAVKKNGYKSVRHGEYDGKMK